MLHFIKQLIYRVTHLVVVKFWQMIKEPSKALYKEKNILQENFHFDVNKLSSVTRWVTLYDKVGTLQSPK